MSRRRFVQVALLGVGAALLPAAWYWPLRSSEVPDSDEIVVVVGWVLLFDDLAVVLG